MHKKNPTTAFVKAFSVFALSPNNVWVAAGGVHHYDGNKWTEEAGIFGAGRANKIWGTKEALWFVGNDGFIARRNSDGSWKQLESGTDLDIQDIWGDYDEKNGKWEILAVASDKYQNNGNKLLKIEGEKVTERITDGLPWSIVSIWFKTQRYYAITGDGYFSNNDLITSWIETKTFPLLYKHSIKGQSLNSIVFCGAYGLISYQNGQSWKNREH